MMARTRCDICHTRHSSDVSNQVCLANQFEIPLGFKEDHNIVGRLVISAQMEDEVVFKQMKMFYDRRVSRWKRYTRFLVLSKRLFIVSRMLGLSHMWATISNFWLWSPEIFRLGLWSRNRSPWDKKLSYYRRATTISIRLPPVYGGRSLQLALFVYSTDFCVVRCIWTGSLRCVEAWCTINAKLDCFDSAYLHGNTGFSLCIRHAQTLIEEKRASNRWD